MSGRTQPIGWTDEEVKMAKVNMRHYIVGRDANGDCTGDFISFSSGTAALAAARKASAKPSLTETTHIEVGRIFNFDEPNEYGNVVANVPVRV
jgi:hypothetical protein